MFPTSRNHQRTVNAAKAYQHESPPTQEGSDSCYGVKSVSSWGEQSEVNDMPGPSDTYAYGRSEIRDEQEETKDKNDDDEDGEGEGESTPEGDVSLSSSGIGLNLEGDQSTQMGQTSPSHQAISPSRPVHTNPEQRIVPPSPEDTVHPLDHSHLSHSEGSPISKREHHHPLTLEHITRSFNVDSPFLPTTSEPSSPASFTSMPSYVASLSSLSRTSSISPMGINEYSSQHPHITDELVLPTLALPSESLSLHMSLNKWTGEEGGLGVILLGEREDVQRCLRRLRDEEALVEIQQGVGVVRDGKIAMRIMTGYISAEQARDRVLHAYSTLNALLHPQLREDTSARAELRRLVEGYIGRSDWIHAVINLNEHEVNPPSLEGIIPVLHSNTNTPPDIANNDSITSTAKTPSLRSIEIEPTPRPSDEASASGYFAPRSYTPSPASSPGLSGEFGIDMQAVSQIISILHDPTGCMDRSIDTFLSWRSTLTHRTTDHLTSPVPSLYGDMTGQGQGERTMASSLTSTSSGVGAMPTVARAQGGGEWEATLSRRVAQRRESDSSRCIRDKSIGMGTSNLRGKGRRKRSLEKIPKVVEKEKDCLPPLFPRKSTSKSKGVSDKGLGVNDMVEKTFFLRSVKKWTRGWRGLLVVGLVVAVGYGCWISKKGSI
ncbi:hypothetical protein I203_104627 [Kwoniella mangroviensis CBS 8507]|uniref:uncharacterized protein n=1 Tax=Kwoniella mangroviensis CBS 8507 TaxID=1296122 RepID=UPI00080D5D6A|nr:uncharacterized protein I203_00426 [Kwoniella mangroviensis CBS 8507]OCF70294.1 hypothetical protein I203_00426 [Kwoniella mangroviensis CBS 8507]